MSEKYIAGVDLGIGATKTVLYRQDRTLVAVAIVEVVLHHLRPGGSCGMWRRMDECIPRYQGISKMFPGVRALDQIIFD